MRKKPIAHSFHGLALTSLCLVALAGCGGKEVNIPLAYVPQDTPYLIANLKPSNPDGIRRAREIYKNFDGQFDEILEMADTELSEEDRNDPEKKAMRDMMKAIFDQLALFKDEASMEKAGLRKGGLVALYGVGAVPVLRLQIKDESKVLASVKEVLKKGKIITNEQALNGGTLLLAGASDVQMFALVAQEQLVLSIVPKGSNAKMYAELAPAAPLESQGALKEELTALKAKYGFTDDAVGYFKPGNFMRFYFAGGNSIEQGFIALAKEPRERPSAVCKKEFEQLATVMPRMVAGTTRFDYQAMNQKFVLELAPNHAKDLMGTTVEIPSYGSGKAFKFALTMDVMKFMSFARSRASAITKTPYKCEALAQFNEGALEMKESLSNPAAGM